MARAIVAAEGISLLQKREDSQTFWRDLVLARVVFEAVPSAVRCATLRWGTFMNSVADTLGAMLQNLGLRAMQREYAACIINAENENWGYRRLLQRLLEIEASARLSRKVERLLEDSGLPTEFTLERL